MGKHKLKYKVVNKTERELINEEMDQLELNEEIEKNIKILDSMKYKENTGKNLERANNSIEFLKENDALDYYLNREECKEKKSYVFSWPILGIIVEDGEYWLTKLLVDAGANVNIQFRIGGRPEIHVPLTLMCSGGIEKFKLLFNSGADPNLKLSNQLTPFIRLFHDWDDDWDNWFKNPDILSLYLEYDANVNSQDEEGNTALHYAFITHQKNLVEILIDYNADIFIKNNRGETPLHVLSRACNHDDDNNDDYDFDEETRTQSEIKKLINYIFKFWEFDVNAQDEDGNTALHLFSQNPDCGIIVEYLVSKDNVDIFIENKSNQTAKDVAASDDIIDILERAEKEIPSVEDSFVKPTDDNFGLDEDRWVEDFEERFLALKATQDKNNERFIQEVVSGNLEKVYEAYKKDGVDIDTQMSFLRQTAIMVAAKFGFKNIVKFLIDEGADLNKQSHTGYTALMYAILNGYTEIAEMLLENGADGEIIGANGENALQFAENRKYDDIVSIIMGEQKIEKVFVKSAKEEKDDNKGLEKERDLMEENIATLDQEITEEEQRIKNTKALHRALKDQNLIKILEIINYDVIHHSLRPQPNLDINAVMSNGETPLLYVLSHSRQNNSSLAEKLLLVLGIDVNFFIEKSKRSPLHIALQRGYSKLSEKLLENPEIDVNLSGRYGSTPLYYAADNNLPEIVKKLLEKPEIDVNAAGFLGRTPLHKAVRRGYTDIVEMLMNHEGINVNATDRWGNTPLFQAQRSEIVEMLLNHEEIDVNVQNDIGNTPLHHAILDDNFGKIEMLLSQDDLGLDIENEDGETPLDLANRLAANLTVEELEDEMGLDRDHYREIARVVQEATDFVPSTEGVFVKSA